jgi:hypothetical protein
MKIGEPVAVAHDCLAVDDAGADPERLDGFNNGPEAVAPIEAAARDEPDALAVPTDNHSEAIMLDFVKPLRPVWRVHGAGRKTHSNGQQLKAPALALSSGVDDLATIGQ